MDASDFSYLKGIADYFEAKREGIAALFPPLERLRDGADDADFNQKCARALAEAKRYENTAAGISAAIRGFRELGAEFDQLREEILSEIKAEEDHP